MKIIGTTINITDPRANVIRMIPGALANKLIWNTYPTKDRVAAVKENHESVETFVCLDFYLIGV